jgi:hypothetical protein
LTAALRKLIIYSSSSIFGGDKHGQEIGANATFWFPEGVGHVEAARTHTGIYKAALVEFFTAALIE